MKKSLLVLGIGLLVIFLIGSWMVGKYNTLVTNKKQLILPGRKLKMYINEEWI